MVRRVTPYGLNERVKEMRLKTFREKLDRAWPNEKAATKRSRTFWLMLVLAMAVVAYIKHHHWWH